MKLAEDLKKAVLQAAMQGKLTKQLETDSSVDELLKKIADEKAKLIEEGKIKKEKPLKEITEEEILFDIPENYCWCRLGEIVNFKMGKTPPRAEAEWWGSDHDIPWISIADMVPNGYISSTKETMSQKSVKEIFSYNVSPKGTLIMSFKLTVGRVSILNVDATHNEAIISIFPYFDESNITRDYLFNVLPMLSQYGEKKDAIKGKTLNSTSLSNIMIPLPPLSEQQRIVEKLNQILPLIDEYGKEEDELIALCQKFPEEMKKSVLQSAMQGKLTKQLESDSSVDELLKKIADEKAKLIAEKIIPKTKVLPEIQEEEITDEIPDNWRWIRLGNLISISSGINLTSAQMKNGQIPVFGGNGITGYHNEGNINKETVVIGRVGYYCGSIHVTPQVAWVTDNAFITTYPEKLINREYLVYALKYLNLGHDSNATAQPVVSGKKIYPMPFPLPPIEEQQRIVEKLNTILPIIDSMAVYGTKKKTGRPKQEEALAFISSLLGTQKSTDSKPAAPEITELKAKAKEELPAVVKKYASLMEVTYNRITIRHQKTRWGSCTKTGNLSFNCLLMKMPENVRDYVIIHELAHRKELNHSTKFWSIVAEYCPWYKEAKQWLKENGQGLMEI